MKLTKALMFGGMFLLTLTGSDCFVVSNFDTSDNDDDDERDRGGLTIGITNGAIISKDAMRSLTQTLDIADVVSESMQYTNDSLIYTDARYSCEASSGEVKTSTYDLDYSNTISSGDEVVFKYSNCTLNDVMVSGDLKISVIDLNGSQACNFENGLNWSLRLHATFDALRITAGNRSYDVKGKMNISVKYTATNALLEAIIDNNNLTITSDSQTHISNSQITQLTNLAVAPSNYVLSVDTHRIYSKEQNGYVDVKAKAISGTEQVISNGCIASMQSPVSGILEIIGKKSAAKVQIIAGDHVNIAIDSDGDSVHEEVIYSNLSEMN